MLRPPPGLLSIKLITKNERQACMCVCSLGNLHKKASCPLVCVSCRCPAAAGACGALPAAGAVRRPYSEALSSFKTPRHRIPSQHTSRCAHAAGISASSADPRGSRGMPSNSVSCAGSKQAHTAGDTPCSNDFGAADPQRQHAGNNLGAKR